MIDIRTEVQDRELMNALNRLRRKTGNLRPIMREISETMKSSVEENFKQESSRGTLYGGGRGGAWADLAPSTLRNRARQSKAGKKLQVTGQLLGSIQTKSDDKEALVGTNKRNKGFSYPLALQEGTKRMPARPFLVLQQTDVQEIKKIIDEYFRGF